MAKADQYMRENRLEQKQVIESMGIMAECYVTAAVAGVLLISIIIPLMTIIASKPPSELFIMYIIAFVLIPLIHTGFSVVLISMAQRV